MSAQKQIIDHLEWNRRLAAAEVSRTDMDNLVLQYLVTEGYKEAAEQFVLESDVKLEVNLSTIGERMAIRNAIQEGDIPLAIEKINDLNPELLDTQPKLYFQLKLQYLIELIRASKVKEALELVQEELSSLCEDDGSSPDLLPDLEAALALLAFPPPASSGGVGLDDGDGAPEGIRRLWEPAQRRGTASAINAAILATQGLDQEPKLLFLLKMLLWSQEQLGQHATFPRIHDLLSARPAHSGCA